jgi:predicted GNAT family acetyltransferase
MTDNEQHLTVVDNPDAGQFEAHIDGHVALVAYIKHGDTMILTHTDVPKELQGRGIASQLARAVLDRARAERWTVIARCPFISQYIERHPEYQSLLRSSTPSPRDAGAP